jgi:phosphogluconate dehydratase
MALVIGELGAAGLIHTDILAAGADDFDRFAREPDLEHHSGDGAIEWHAISASRNPEILRGLADAFAPDGGMRLVTGNLGRATFKTSAVAEDRWTIEAPARVFTAQDDVVTAFKAASLTAMSLSSSGFRGRAPMACPSFTS